MRIDCNKCGVILTKDNCRQYKNRRRWAICRRCVNKMERDRYLRRRERVLERQKNIRRLNKQKMIDAYGGRCSCCGETTFEFLTIEHINKDGAKHRREIGGSKRIHQWLKDNNYPKDGFTILCFNCNAASFFYGECPHKKSLLAQSGLQGRS